MKKKRLEPSQRTCRFSHTVAYRTKRSRGSTELPNGSVRSWASCCLPRFSPFPPPSFLFFPQFSNPTEINNRKKSESSPPSPRPKSLVPSSRDQNRFDRKISFNRLRFALPVRCQVRSASPSSLVIAPRISVLNPCSRGLAGVGGRVSRLIVSSRRRFWGCCTDWSSIARVGSTWEVQIPVSGCKWLARMELECFTISACFCLQY
jgi:hypothetical protein